LLEVISILHFIRLIKVSEELPNLITPVNVAGRSADAPHRQILAPVGPGVPAALDAIKYHFRV
jgi:alkyl hydroperoxide reductase subunit AhpF